MTTIQGTLTKPSGAPIRGARLAFTLVVADAAFDAHTELAQAVTATTGADGTWEVDLTANDDIAPTGTAYRRTGARSGLKPVVFTVPTGAGPFDFDQLISVDGGTVGDDQVGVIDGGAP